MNPNIAPVPNMLRTVENIVFNPDDLANVWALVMMRDASTAGWIPLGSGALSRVSVRQCSMPDESGEMNTAYLICGQTPTDNTIILSCFIEKGTQYKRVMPTFHHWRSEEYKFGLIFQTAADARAFDKGLNLAVYKTFGGTGEKPPRFQKKRSRKLHNEEKLELPVSDVDHPSTSDSSVGNSPQSLTEEQAAQISHFFGTTSDSESESPTQSEMSEHFKFPAGQHPNAEGTKLVPEPSASVKKKGTETVPQNVEKPPKDKKISGRHLCRYCQEIYVEEDNRRGACEYAPDCVRTTIDEVTCVRAARCMTYHCMSDEEGEFAQHPCECTCGENGRFRWMGLAVLSIFFPCLCLYPPLRSCHWCCLRAGFCGARHRPAS